MMDPSSGSWISHNDQTLPAASQDEFQQFMDMNMSNLGDGINFDYQDFADQHDGQLLHREMDNVMDTTMEGMTMGLMSAKDNMLQDNLMVIPMNTSLPLIPQPSVNMAQATDNNISEIDAQIQLLQYQKHQQQMQAAEHRRQQQQQQQQQQEQQQQQHAFFAQHRIVPPTPNSIEMHGNGNNQYYTQNDAQMYGRYQLRLKDQELAFTPLVSPAVTPLEAHFAIADYSMPGTYFSPLSSPALHAQQEQQRYNISVDNSSTITSPIDLDIDLNAQPPSTGPTPQKPTRKAPPKAKSRSVRQSPIVKPQRRKAGGSTVISPQTLTDILEPALQSQTPRMMAPAVKQQSKPQVSVSKSVLATSNGSDIDSVSPEQLTDMAPPPLPKSKSSPFLVGQNHHPSRTQQLGQSAMSPATPASLMRLPKNQQTSPSSGETQKEPLQEDHAMEDFALPEPANPRPNSVVAQSLNLPTSTIVPVPSLPASITRNQSAKSSPALRPQTSETSLKSKTTPLLRATPKLAVRGSVSGASSAAASTKKRASVSSNVLISPALRPKLSPSLGPTIRGSGFSAHHITDDTASQLLAVKSNYQNILEGTHLPGVSYPSELSTNLTSKRTSHKLAEQGRRNRINTALTEMATLLPRKGVKETTPIQDASADDVDDASCGGKKGDKDSKNAQSSSSKASTVEHAIEYIKQLQKEVEEATKRAEVAEQKLLESG